MNLGPRSGRWSEGKNLLDAIVSLDSAVENDISWGHEGFMVGNVSRASSGGLNRLPLNVVVGIVLELLNPSEIHAPHGGHLALLYVSTAVNVQVVDALLIGWSKYERAMV